MSKSTYIARALDFEVSSTYGNIETMVHVSRLFAERAGVEWVGAMPAQLYGSPIIVPSGAWWR